jgi:soluble P-type ATPase
LSVATLQAEGIHTGIIPYVDIIVPNINDALDLFADANTMAATMRK